MQSIGQPDEGFSLTIAKRGEEGVPVAEFFDVEEPELESWNFTWYVQRSTVSPEGTNIIQV